MTENPRDDRNPRSEACKTTTDHLKPGAAANRNGVPILPSRGEKITLAHVQEILDDEGI